MIKFFRHIRRALLGEGKFSKYLLYAIGEIILVVIGILIALQINNANELRKERAKEVGYLENLKVDLQKEIENAKYFANYHFEKAKACVELVNGTAPTNIAEVQLYTDRYEQVFIWYDFVPNNNTFKELLSSGNLSLIKNDTIKTSLLELDKIYAEIATGEYHMRREYEEYLYNTHVKNISALEFFDLTQAKLGFPDRLKPEDFSPQNAEKLIADAQWQHNDQTFQNGLKLALMNNGFLADMHNNLVLFLNELIQIIETEIEL